MNNSWVFPKESQRAISLYDRIKDSRGTNFQKIQNNVNYFHSAYNIPDISKAAIAVQYAIENRIPIRIFGDYDCDGVCASLILRKYISSKTSLVSNFIPNRLKDGYGMKMEQVKRIPKEVGLVITVDTGISSVSEIQYLKDQGKTVVVTDHHICPAELPPADAIVSCQRTDSTYPFCGLCGAGVAFKLVSVLCDLYGDNISDMDDLFVLVMLATIADSVPLIDENRAFVQVGLSMLRVITDMSIIDFFRQLKIDTQNVTSEDIAFMVAPVINAAGRISGSAKTAMLAFCNDKDVRNQSIDRLLKFNTTRKNLSASTTLKAETMLLKSAQSDNFMNHVYPICIFGENWSKGILGIVAARIAKKYNRPTLIFTNSKESPEVYTGSCRGCEKYEINIYEMLSAASEFIESFGGHEFAAGLVVTAKKKDAFYKAICSYVEQNASNTENETARRVDVEIFPEEINMDTISVLKEFEPFGNENKEPLFFCRDLFISNISLMGKNSNHLKVALTSANSKNSFSGVFFYQTDMFYAYKDLPKDTKYTAVFQLRVNRFRGKESVQMMLQDLFPNFESSSEDPQNQELNQNAIVKMTDFLFQIVTESPRIYNLELLSMELSSATKCHISFEQTLEFLKTLQESSSIKILRINEHEAVLVK